MTMARVLEYYTRVIFHYYSSTRYFLFPVDNFHLRLQFLQSIDELLEFMETWGIAISFGTCQPGNTCRGGATEPAAGLKAKASAQRYNNVTIDSMSVVYLLTANDGHQLLGM